MRRKIFCFLMSAAVIAALIFGLTACSPVQSIDKDFDKISKNGNYTLAIGTELMTGRVESVRKYDADKIYLNYGDGTEIFYDDVDQYRIGVYRKFGEVWKRDTITADSIDFAVSDNFAYSAFELALKDRTKYYNKDKKGYTLKEEFYKKVFGGIASGSAKIVREDGATTIIAEFNSGRTDKIRIENVGKTKINLPSVQE